MLQSAFFTSRVKRVHQPPSLSDAEVDDDDDDLLSTKRRRRRRQQRRKSFGSDFVEEIPMQALNNRVDDSDSDVIICDETVSTFSSVGLVGFKCHICSDFRATLPQLLEQHIAARHSTPEPGDDDNVDSDNGDADSDNGVDNERPNSRTSTNEAAGTEPPEGDVETVADPLADDSENKFGCDSSVANHEVSASEESKIDSPIVPCLRKQVLQNLN